MLVLVYPEHDSGGAKGWNVKRKMSGDGEPANVARFAQPEIGAFGLAACWSLGLGDAGFGVSAVRRTVAQLTRTGPPSV